MHDRVTRILWHGHGMLSGDRNYFGLAWWGIRKHSSRSDIALLVLPGLNHELETLKYLNSTPAQHRKGKVAWPGLCRHPGAPRLWPWHSIDSIDEHADVKPKQEKSDRALTVLCRPALSPLWALQLPLVIFRGAAAVVAASPDLTPGTNSEEANPSQSCWVWQPNLYRIALGLPRTQQLQRLSLQDLLHCIRGHCG